MVVFFLCILSVWLYSMCFSVHYVKRPGAVLDGGSVVAHLDLDDPSRVQQAQSFTGTLPQPQAPPTHGEKLHQLFQSTRAELENILAGYSLPEPYFRPKLQESIERLMKCLRDPALPLLELQVHVYNYICAAIKSFLISALSQSNINKFLLNSIWFMLSSCTYTCINGIFSLYFSFITSCWWNFMFF